LLILSGHLTANFLASLFQSGLHYFAPQLLFGAFKFGFDEPRGVAFHTGASLFGFTQNSLPI
jgi:hypothetical protein